MSRSVRCGSRAETSASSNGSVSRSNSRLCPGPLLRSIATSFQRPSVSAYRNSSAPRRRPVSRLMTGRGWALSFSTSRPLVCASSGASAGASRRASSVGIRSTAVIETGDAARRLAGNAHQQRRAELLVPGSTMRRFAVLPEALAVIADDDHRRAPPIRAGFERGQQLRELRVLVAQLAVVAVDRFARLLHRGDERAHDRARDAPLLDHRLETPIRLKHRRVGRRGGIRPVRVVVVHPEQERAPPAAARATRARRVSSPLRRAAPSPARRSARSRSRCRCPA